MIGLFTTLSKVGIRVAPPELIKVDASRIAGF
jgi:hypothetical protein